MRFVENIEDRASRRQVGGKLQSLEEWLERLSQFKSLHHKCETNCYIPLPQMEEYIKEGRLSYKILSDTSLWLFEQERDYYLGYYYVSKEESLYIQPQDLDVVIYLIGSEKKYAKKREEELVGLGCERYRRNLEYMLTSEKVPELRRMDERCRRLMEKIGFRYAKFHKEDYESVYALWRERIDHYSVKDMLPGRIFRMEQEEECLLIRDRDDRMIAACVFEINGAVGFSENVATVAASNGIGLGGVLFSRSLLNIFSRGCQKDCMWVWEGNVESRKMTERFAELSGRFSQQLLLRRQSNIDIKSNIDEAWQNHR